MISKAFAFHAPRELDEALALLERHGPEATVLAGGMSLVPAMNLGLAQPAVIISLNHLPALEDVAEGDGTLRIGAMVRHARVQADPLIRRLCPVLSEAAGLIGDVQVRHRGTIGGSVAHADPAADYLPVLAAAGARVRLRSSRGERAVPAGEFFVDLMLTARAPNELVVEVQVPALAAPFGTAYQRLARVEGSFAIVTAAAVIERGGRSARVAIGGVGPRPVLIPATDCVGGGLSAGALERLDQAVDDASQGAYGDIHADPEYRRAMAQVFARRALQAAAGRLS